MMLLDVAITSDYHEHYVNYYGLVRWEVTKPKDP